VRQFRIAGVQPAGQKALAVKRAGCCVEIMTGAVVPAAFDAVIPVEQIKIVNKVAVVSPHWKVCKGDHIRRQGSDCKKGATLLKVCSVLGPQQIGIAASVGRSKLKVTARPRIAIISTGDELVDIGVSMKPFQTRLSNSYALEAAFLQTGFCETEIFHIKDNLKEMCGRLAQILKKFDVIVLSGGVSMGKFDYVPQVLKKLKVRVLFHKVTQKPGKPFWFGKSQEGKPVFALPGNPVSTQVCAYRYVLPYLRKSIGLRSGLTELAVLSQVFEVKTDLTYFLPIQFDSNAQGKVWAKPVTIGGSGDFAALAKSQGFVELAAGKRKFPKGSLVKLFCWKT
ncbi:MAG: hypothetical protein A3D10_07260, partial [Omnitrophica WOR_2 bacterium RIFCSPHIGHO2_02_FULL_48_11]